MRKIDTYIDRQRQTERKYTERDSHGMTETKSEGSRTRGRIKV